MYKIKEETNKPNNKHKKKRINKIDAYEEEKQIINETVDNEYQ